MLDNMRGFATTWLGKLLGAFLLVGLAGFGVSGVLTGIGASNVASVGGEDITIRDFQRAYNSQLNTFSARLGRLPTAEQAVAFGIPSGTIGQLAAEGALNALTRDLGLGASDDRLAILLRQDPSFAGVLGNFDPQNFQRALQQAGYTENEYIATQLKAARRQQFSEAVFGGVTSPVAAERLVQRYGGDQRSIDYFVLSSTSLLPPEEPTEDELAAYLTENQSRFRTVPTRTAKFIVLSPEAIAAKLQIAETDIAAEYERTKANYITVETRNIRQVVLPSDTLAAQFQAGLDAGATFDELVEAAALTVTDLGNLSKAGITDPALAEAAFSLAQGSFTLIPAAQGMRAIQVTEITPGGQRTLDEVSIEIAERLKLREAKDQFVDVLDQIEELRAAFQPLDEIASRFGLSVNEIALTASGAELSELGQLPADGRTKVSGAVFAANQDELVPTVSINANLNVWFDLISTEAARDQTLDEVRELIQTQINEQRTAEALAEKADAIVAEIEGGAAFGDVAAAQNLFPQLSQPFTRSGDGSPVIDQTVAAAVFNGGEGLVGSALNGEGDYVVFIVTAVNPVAEVEPTDARTALDDSFVNSLYSNFATAIRNDKGVQINEGVLSQVLGLTGNQ